MTTLTRIEKKYLHAVVIGVLCLSANPVFCEGAGTQIDTPVVKQEVQDATKKVNRRRTSQDHKKQAATSGKVAISSLTSRQRFRSANAFPSTSAGRADSAAKASVNFRSRHRSAR